MFLHDVNRRAESNEHVMRFSSWTSASKTLLKSRKNRPPRTQKQAHSKTVQLLCFRRKHLHSTRQHSQAGCWSRLQDWQLREVRSHKHGEGRGCYNILRWEKDACTTMARNKSYALPPSPVYWQYRTFLMCFSV